MLENSQLRGSLALKNKMSRQQSMLLSTLSVWLLLAMHPMQALAGLPAINADLRDITAADFKMLAQAANPTQLPQGGKRALLESTAFSQDFFRILEPILEGNTGMRTFTCCRLHLWQLPARSPVMLQLFPLIQSLFRICFLCFDAMVPEQEKCIWLADGAASAIVAASTNGDTTAIANAFSLSFAYGYAVPAAYAAAAATQRGSPDTCDNFAAAAYISALTNAIAISSTEAAAQAIYAAFTLGW